MNDKIGKYYSSKTFAQLMGKSYAEQEKEDVYLHETIIGPNQFEYSLRSRSEIVNPESVNILMSWEYTPANPLNIVEKNSTKTPERTATGYESNVPAGMSSNPSAPFNEAETYPCPKCDGRSAKDEEEYCSTCECSGKLTEAGYPAHIN